MDSPGWQAPGGQVWAFKLTEHLRAAKDSESPCMRGLLGMDFVDVTGRAVDTEHQHPLHVSPSSVLTSYVTLSKPLTLSGPCF